MDSRNRPSIAGSRKFVGRAPVVSFFVVTFGWSWGYWTLVGALVGPDSVSYVVALPGLWGPPVAATTVVWASGSGLRAFFGRVFRIDVPARWYAIAFGGAIALGLVAPFIQGRLAGGGFELRPISPVIATAVAMFAGGSEEIGLRGFAHPLLRDRLSALSAGFLIGVVWAVWHVPLQWLGVGFDGPFAIFVASTVALSVLLGWLYDGTGGSVLPVVIAHAAIDAPSVLSPAGSIPDDVTVTSQLGATAVYWLLVAGLVVKNGRQLSSGSSPPPPNGPITDRSPPNASS